MITLDQAIDHFTAIGEMAKAKWDSAPEHLAIASFLRRLKRYEQCLAEGTLVWAQDIQKTPTRQEVAPAPVHMPTPEQPTEKPKKTRRRKQ
jgi:hypothetical protein